jgi:hypothetical protein
VQTRIWTRGAGTARILAALALAAALAGCATTAGGARRQAALERHYAEAVLRAAVFEPADALPLTALSTDPATLVSWTTYAYEPGAQTLPVDLWVTADPEVAERCRRFPDADRILRLQQLLGLPPDPENGAERRFVVLRARLADVFRPCTNPDPTSRGPCAETFPEAASTDHRLWLGDWMLEAYQLPHGYPYTRLGYTYDWGRPPGATRYGVSEFVVAEGAWIEVVAVVPTAEYCGGGRP